MTDTPLLIIARDEKDADKYARSNDVENFIHVKNVESLRGIERGLEYVWAPGFMHLTSIREWRAIREVLNIRGHSHQSR